MHYSSVNSVASLSWCISESSATFSGPIIMILLLLEWPRSILIYSIVIFGSNTSFKTNSSVLVLSYWSCYKIIAAAMSWDWRSQWNLNIECISLLKEVTGSVTMHWLFLYTIMLCPGGWNPFPIFLFLTK
jgi:hypothetical protein